MKIARYYFYLIAIITMALGIALVFFPYFVAGLFFDILRPETIFFARICGSTLIGFAGLNYLTARAASRQFYQIAAWSNILTLLVAMIISTLAAAQFNHHLGLFTVQHATFAAGFGYVLYKLRDTSKR